MLNIEHCTSREFVRTWVEVTLQHEYEKASWIAYLRSRGVRAAHPDNGWVNRQYHYLQFLDAVFMSWPRPEVGDVIALGEPKKFRLVRITEVRSERYFIMMTPRYYFEPVPDPEMPRMLYLRHVWWPAVKDKIMQWFK